MRSEDGKDEIAPCSQDSVRTIRTHGGSNEAAINGTIRRTEATGVGLEMKIGTKTVSPGRVKTGRIRVGRVRLGRVRVDQVSGDHRGKANGVDTGNREMRLLLQPKMLVRALARDIIIEGVAADHPNKIRTAVVLTISAQIRANRREVGSIRPDRMVATVAGAEIRTSGRRTTGTSRGKAVHHTAKHAASDRRKVAARDRASSAETTRTETTHASDSSSIARTGQHPRPTSSR